MDVYRAAVVVELGILIVVVIGVGLVLLHGTVYPCASAVVGLSVGRITVLKGGRCATSFGSRSGPWAPGD
jgi:hypothetical protein